MSTIRYFVPEDGDVEDSPNVYLAPKPSQAGYPPLLGQIRDSFPLPGNFHFRFKTALVPGTDQDKNAVAVWMDSIDDSDPVPLWQNSIIAKVTRTRTLDEDNDDTVDFARAYSNVSTGGFSSRSSQSKESSKQLELSTHHSSDSLLGAFDDPPNSAPLVTNNSTHSSIGNLLDVDHHHPTAPPSSGGSLLDMDHLETTRSGCHSSGTNTPTEHDELLNMTAPMPAQPRPNSAGGVAQHPHPYPPPGKGPRPQQQGPMPGQYPLQMHYPAQGQFGQQQGLTQMTGQQTQINHSARNSAMNGAGNKNAFDKFSSNSLDPLGNLNWGK